MEDKGTASEPEELNLTPGPTEWKERTDSLKLSSECHVSTVAYAHPHVKTRTHAQMFFKWVNFEDD